MSGSRPTGQVSPGRLERSAHRLLLCSLAAALVLTGGAPETCHSVPKTTHIKLAVVKSLDLPEYNLAYAGFVSTLQGTGYDLIASIVTLGRTDAEVDSALRAISGGQPDLILALGSRAAREVSRYEKTIPIVYSMVLAPSPGAPGADPLPSQQNVTGASLNIPLRAQLQKIKLVFPTARRIGVISDPAQTRQLVDSAVQIAKSSGLDLHVQWVKSESDVPNALRALTDSMDVFWMLPDQTVLTARSSRYIIFELIKSGVPIMGLSSAYVKAGALIALDCNYRDVGQQSGELALRILGGQSPSQLPHTQPRLYTLAVNAKVREQIRIPIDESAVKDSNVTTF